VVTGGIGAGKSTVTSLLEAHGAVVVEADRIGHEVLRHGHPVATSVADRWPEVVDHTGEIDRSRLGEIVFADEAELSALEALTHPAIAAEIAHRADDAGDVAVVVEIPVLRPWFDERWWWIAVTADAGLRLERAAGRGAGRADVERRMSAQPSNEDYAAAADFVVINEGDLGALADRVADVWSELHGG
jgi:dephospho-CoA kinase